MNLENLTPNEVLVKMWRAGGLSLYKHCQLTRHLVREKLAFTTWSNGGFDHMVCVSKPTAK
jgi:hypothetical protein